jgi:hypothetical protein
MDEKEVSWTKLFAFDLPAVRPAKVSHECCDACKEAREIKCVCACGGKNHGAANRAGMEPLDKTLGLEAPAPLGLEWPFDEK